MIQLPASFDVALFVSELVSIAVPFVGIGFLIASGILILNLLDGPK
ncbi:MAG: hypothetical protein OCC45_13315 [Desulfotalea sp.]